MSSSRYEALQLEQVDAFASSKPFSGNPAAVVTMKNGSFLPDEMLQAIAEEINLSETAYTVFKEEGEYALRWFTPAVEVDLCGHATMAAAHTIFESGVGSEVLRFETKSGILEVRTPHLLQGRTRKL